MIVIASGRYVDGELASELGKLPPSFLPVGNKRLFEHQVELIKAMGEPIVLTLPSGFSIPHFDELKLRDLGVDVRFVDPNVSLGRSIYSVLCQLQEESIKDKTAGINILFGDTLFSKLPKGSDIYSVGKNTEFYSWGTASEMSGYTEFINGVDAERKETDILSGWFALSDSALFVDSLRHADFDFFLALTNYSRSNSMKSQDVTGWMDFGHVHTYFMSKAKRTTERSFNSINIENRVVEKRSSKNRKILSEALWFENIPSSFRLFTPIYLGKREGSEISYKVEYLYLSTLNELFVHGLLPEKVWNRIFDSCENFLSEARKIKTKEDLTLSVSYLLKQKCRKRIKLYNVTDKIDIDIPVTLNGKVYPPLNTIVDELISSIDIKELNASLMHGDFCFSNILYDFRVNDIKVIDPRGTIDDEDISIFGDSRYDVAKFMHSIIGYYDLIIAGYFEVDCVGVNEYNFDVFVDSRQKKLSDLFMSRAFFQNAIRDGSFEIMILLFVSMVPLHTEDKKRQLGLLLNAYRLFEIRQQRN